MYVHIFVCYPLYLHFINPLFAAAGQSVNHILIYIHTEKMVAFLINDSALYAFA